MHENIVKIRRVKPEIRVLGVDDGVFVPHSKGVATVVGVVYRGGYWLDGVMRTEVEIDGMDATEKIASMITTSPHYDQLRVVMLNGVTFAGFNMVDIKKLFERVRLPVITVTREKPDLDDIRRALRNLPEYENRLEAMENAGKLIEVHTRDAEQAVYVQIVGISEKDAEKILKSTSTRSNIPEALRVAHIIASGLTRSKEKV
ncbi:DUF99 family protein [Candidatus Bathyarchaeota archaeon]|nr:MAG: DUF99 family protein [Candidatus Bathyarchaeota archaeon]